MLLHIRLPLCLAFILGLGVPPAVAAQPAEDRMEVDPFIGTGAHGHTYPGATLPFGMVQVSPDSRLDPGDWDGCSGYHLGDPVLYGFSHTHLSGTGCSDGCDVLLAPHTGPARLGDGRDGNPGYGSAYEHARETAVPGYYSVQLKDFGVLAEVTASARCGFHRYTFPPGREARITLDLTHRDQVLDSGLEFVGDREIRGWRRSRSWTQDQKVYFVARFSRPFRQWGIADPGGFTPSRAAATGTSLKAHAAFGTGGGPVLVKVGLSAVDLDGARNNLETELPDWDFAGARRRAADAWRAQLARISVEGGTPAQRTAFHTALYHVSLAPTLFQDADGRYLGRDQRVHAGDGGGNYTTFSLWDTFRAEHPLLVLIDRARTGDFLRTFLRQYEQGGRLPVWELWANETDCMMGYHAVSVLADALAKGIDAVDPERALEAMKHSAELDRDGQAEYRARGFVPIEAADRTVSRTLEYAYDDWCIAQVARRLGRMDDYTTYSRRALGYRNLYDPATGFFRARHRDGSWRSPFDPFEIGPDYTEADAWQYRCFVPQDMAGFMALQGGPAAFARNLDALFAAPSTTHGGDDRDISGMIGQYAQGNEPSHHVAYLYAFAGQPWKTQALVRRLQAMYTDQPDGLVGNEDCGQMSAWYVLSALGFYAVTPGTTTYVLGSPLFPKATLHLENGKAFTVRAVDNAPGHPYIQSATLNGRPYGKAYLDYADIMAGGELTLVMGAKPNTTWGTGPGNAPATAIN